MSDEVSMDEAANTALLLEQHIQEKMAQALADFMFGDTIGSKTSVHNALASGNMPFTAMTVREQLIFQIVHSEVFKNNMTYLVKNIIREETEGLRRMVREEFARGILNNTFNSNRTG
jgi:hypothetical protein